MIDVKLVNIIHYESIHLIPKMQNPCFGYFQVLNGEMHSQLFLLSRSPRRTHFRLLLNLDQLSTRTQSFCVFVHTQNLFYESLMLNLLIEVGILIPFFFFNDFKVTYFCC